MSMNIIVGIGKDGLIGKGNALPWSVPEDLKNFKRLTSGNVVIMGLRTFESIGSKPLPNRINIVLNFEKLDLPVDAVCTSIPEAIEKAKTYGKDIFIMGGMSIYKQFLPLVDKLYISHIEGEYEGDVFFPEYDRSEWEVEKEEQMPGFLFRIYRRKK